MERKLYETVTFKIVVIAAAFVVLYAPVRQWFLASAGF
ncbi:hypothetical protein WSK_4063 [Novosphingobium sp. Rr 2-17]|nr:hypothetical protein WSK_4063 [Novosphingobium sp. Rr 2-17]